MTNRVRFRHEAPCRTRYLTQDPTTPLGLLTSGTIVAIESYAGSIPTFTWQSATGHLFASLPPLAFSLEDEGPGGWADFVCPPGPIVAHDFGFEGDGYGKMGDFSFRWKRYLLSVDWTEGNLLAHLCLSFGGHLTWFRNSRFQVGGARFDPPTHWRKQRETWGVFGPLRPGSVALGCTPLPGDG
jgi:hypothetical protein